MPTPFTQSIIEKIAELKIQEAIKEGQFEDLPGFGKPFEFDLLQHARIGGFGGNLSWKNWLL